MDKNVSGFLKYTIITGLVALLFIPFIYSGDLIYPHVTSKAYFFRIILGVIFFLWVILAINNKEYRPKKSPLLYSLIAFLISIFISNLNGVNFTASFWSNYERMDGYINLLHIFALFIVTSSVLKSIKEWKYFFDVIIISNFIFVIYAFQKLFLSEGLPTGYRLDIFIGNPAYVAIYLLFVFFITLYNLSQIQIKQKLFVGFYVLMLLSQIYLIFETSTRGAIIGLFGGLFISMCLIFIFNKKDKNLSWKISGIGLLGIAILVSGFFIFKDSSFIQQNDSLKRLANISISDQTTNSRILNWQVAFEGFKERPILGWGQSNYTYVFDKHYLPALHGNETFFDRVHNFVFDWLIAGGALGLLFYLAIFISAIYLIILNEKFSRNQKSILIGLILAYLINNIFIFDQLISYLYIFIVLALIQSTQNNSFNIFEKELSNSFIKISSIVCLILIPVSMYFVNLDNYYANKDLITGMRMFTQKEKDGPMVFAFSDGPKVNMEYFEGAIGVDYFNPNEAREKFLQNAMPLTKFPDSKNYEQDVSEFISKALDAVLKTANEDPLNARHHYLLGIAFFNFGNFEESIKSFERAVELAPKKQVYRIPLIKALMAIKQNEKAIALAKETYELDKTKDDVWFEYFLVNIVSKINILNDEEEIKNLNENRIKLISDFLNGKIDKEPKEISGYISLAAFYFQINEKEKSVETLERAIEQAPTLKNQLNSFIKIIRDGGNPLKQTIRVQ
jgi:O-antigen ligase